MITVYRVSGPGFETVHLHLPFTAWGNEAIKRAGEQGYLVEATDLPQHPDTRTVEELERVNTLLDELMPE